MIPPRFFSTAPRLLAGFGSLALLTSIGFFASRPAHTAGGPIAVTVGNVVRSSNVDSPDQQPFQIVMAPHSNFSRFADEAYAVPPGKRLVIDYYTARLGEYPGGGYASVYLETTVGGENGFYPVVPAVASTAPYNQMTHICADPGTLLDVQVASSSGSSCNGAIVISGHFVDVN